MKNTHERGKSPRKRLSPKARLMVGITAGMLFPIGSQAMGDGELDPTPPTPRPAPKPTPADKALKFPTVPLAHTFKPMGSKAALLEIRHALSARKADLPSAVHATDARTFPTLKPFAPKKGGPLPEWVKKFISSKGKP